MRLLVWAIIVAVTVMLVQLNWMFYEPFDLLRAEIVPLLIWYLHNLVCISVWPMKLKLTLTLELTLTLTLPLRWSLLTMLRWMTESLAWSLYPMLTLLRSVVCFLQYCHRVYTDNYDTLVYLICHVHTPIDLAKLVTWVVQCTHHHHDIVMEYRIDSIGWLEKTIVFRISRNQAR